MQRVQDRGRQQSVTCPSTESQGVQMTRGRGWGKLCRQVWLPWGSGQCKLISFWSLWHGVWREIDLMSVITFRKVTWKFTLGRQVVYRKPVECHTHRLVCHRPQGELSGHARNAEEIRDGHLLSSRGARILALWSTYPKRRSSFHCELNPTKWNFSIHLCTTSNQQKQR